MIHCVRSSPQIVQYIEIVDERRKIRRNGSYRESREQLVQRSSVLAKQLPRAKTDKEQQNIKAITTSPFSQDYQAKEEIHY